MVTSRELGVTTDSYAYEEDEINNYAITFGYATATDNITYQNPANTTTPAFKSLRVTSFSDTSNRSVIVEESIDQVSAASIYGGTDGVNGQFEAAFRGWDFHLSGLLAGALGAQTPTDTTAVTNVRKVGKKYILSMVPQVLALKIVDEQATDTAGSNNVIGTTTIYRGVGINSMELALQVKEYVKATFQWMGRRAEVFDAPYNTSSTVNGEPAIFYNATLKWEPYTGSSYGTAETIKCKGFTMTLSRTMDQDYFYIGSEFLQGLYYNGLTDLGGEITLGAGDWQRIRATISGAVTGGNKVLDQANKEFFGTRADGNVLANAIPAGRFTVVLHNPAGTYEVTKIVCDMAKLTEMTRSVQGRNQFEKKVSWKAQINVTDTFYLEVYTP